MIKKILLYVLTIFPIFSVCGQTVDWRVNPEYSSIEPFAEGLYKVRDNRKSGIIDENGRVVVPIKYDRITPFYEGLAVIYDTAPEGPVFKGVLSESGEANFAEDRYYLLPEYPFYSEGLIPVIEPGGKFGYLNFFCQPAFRFIEEEVRPFSEGVAAVGAGDDFCMMTSHGERMPIALPDGEYAFGGTNYYNGKSLVWDGDWVCYILDSSGQMEKIGRQNLSDLRVDYLYRFGSGINNNPEYVIYSPTHDKEWTPVQKDGRWTFSNASGKLLSVYRYDSLQPFIEGVAIASTNGKFGLLEVVEDNSTFYSTVTNTRHTYSPGKSVKCSFALSTPEKWAGQTYTVLITDPLTGEALTYEKKENLYSFNVSPNSEKKSEEREFNISVSHDGMNIWEGRVNYEFNQRSKIQATIRLQNADADSSDKCYVVATIKNPSSVPVTTTVSLSGGGTKASFAGKTITVTIPPYGTKSVSSAFTVRKVELNGWCAVSTSDGASARRNGLQLKPF